jgi:hypothetical protein
MFGLGPATKVYLALGATDMRKGFDGPSKPLRMSVAPRAT